MGYTHYYELTSMPTNAEALYRDFAAGVAVIIEQATNEGDTIADGAGQTPLAWNADSNRVAFNGFAEMAHESFHWSGNAADNMQFKFTKTAYKPYDRTVVAVLILLKKIYGDHVRIFSDGSWDSEWTYGRALYERAMDETAKYPFDEVEAIA